MVISSCVHMFIPVCRICTLTARGGACPRRRQGCLCDCVCVYVCMYVYIYMCVCMYVCKYVCMYVYMYICVYVCMYVRMCMRVCVWGSTWRGAPVQQQVDGGYIAQFARKVEGVIALFGAVAECVSCVV
jgi:hypothetical protein